MALEQPETGAGAVRATPSNFSEVMQARAAAEASGGVASSGYNQPQSARIGGLAAPNGPVERGNQSEQDIDPSKVDKRLDASQADPEQDPADPEAFEQEEGQADAEVLARREAAAKVEEALSMGLPVDHEAIKDMLVTVTPDGIEMEVPFSELRRGFMRHSTFTRKLNQANQLGGQAMTVLRAEQQRNADWKDPANILRDVESMGLLDQFEEAMYRYAQEKVNFAKLPPHEQYRIQGERDKKRMQMQFDRERAQMMAQLQQNQQQAPDQRTQRFGNQLAQLMPKAFKANAFPTYPHARDIFFKNLQIMHENSGSGDLTYEMVNDATIAAKEELADLGQRMLPPKRPANQNGLPARRMPGAPGNGVGGQHATGQRRRPSEFGGRFNTGGF